MQVGLPETAGSNGKPDDKEKREFQASGSQQEKEKAAERFMDNEAQAHQQLQQLKKQHRLQLQERNRQICHLQEDREKLRQSLRKAESNLRFAVYSAPTAQVLHDAVNAVLLPEMHLVLTLTWPVFCQHPVCICS